MAEEKRKTHEICEDVDVFEESPELLRNTPSRKDGVDKETECMLRIYGCELIQVSCRQDQAALYSKKQAC